MIPQQDQMIPNIFNPQIPVNTPVDLQVINPNQPTTPIPLNTISPQNFQSTETCQTLLPINNPVPNLNPNILMALSYLHSHLIGQAQSPLADPSQGVINSTVLPLQQQSIVENNANVIPQKNKQNTQLKSSSNRGKDHRDFRENDRREGSHRSDRDARNDRGDRYRGDRHRENERDYRDERESDRRGYNHQYNSERHKRTDNYSRDLRDSRHLRDLRDRRSDRRYSRSRSRSYDRRDEYVRDERRGSYDRDRYEEQRYRRRDSYDDYDERYDDRYQKGSPYEGDENYNWKCVDCGNVNWPKRDKCNRCQLRRPTNAPLLLRDSNSRNGNQEKEGYSQKSKHSTSGSYKKYDYKSGNDRHSSSNRL